MENNLASFPGHSRLQFLITSSMLNRGWRPERVMCMTSGRCEGRHEGAVPDKESWDPSFKILSKTLRLKCLKDSVNTARYSVDSRLINTRFVSYKDWASPPSCLPSRLADVMHMTLSPSRFCMLQAITNWRQERPGNEARNNHAMFQNWFWLVFGRHPCIPNL